MSTFRRSCFCAAPWRGLTEYLRGTNLCPTLGLVVASCALLAGAGTASAVIIDTVPVGDVGNAADTATGYGQVNYAYNIGKYEVTAGQYTAFLNAVGRVDAHALYNSGMSTIFGSGITRSGGGTSANPYTYSVASDFTDRPVNYVRFWDACRFTNWLQNGQGNGDTETGAYTLTPTGIANNTITRNTGWQWAVTSEDEWYKAAYYKGGGTNAGYWLYPTKNDTAPGRNMSDPLPGNNANIWPGGTSTSPIDNGHFTTVVGEFQNSASPYGTFDQGGNVNEWNEAITGASLRGMRGGWYDGNTNPLRATQRAAGTVSYENYDVGFRVSQVPEPASIAILAFCVTGLLPRRRDRRG
jgi:formylglycine-generating enzyme